MTHIIAITHPKGGTGKTTIINPVAGLARFTPENRVLLADNDPQPGPGCRVHRYG